MVSRGAAIVLLIEFACFLWFSHYSHTDFDENDLPSIRCVFQAAAFVPTSIAVPSAAYTNEVRGTAESLIKLRDHAMKHHPRGATSRRPWYLDLLLLAAASALLVFASIFLIESMHGVSQKLSVSESFVGLVIMPCVLASLEYTSNALRSRKEGIAWLAEDTLGACIRVCFFALPISIVVGWGLDKDMDMIFDGFQVTTVALAVFMVNHVIHNSFAHW